jgi:phosphoribosylformimino-5-aminoimidazole carboxamide ribotide isomerase
MHILPAIDIRAGKCVRLFQGDYAQETIYYDNPVDVAKMWQDQGATYLHVVDLDGAKNGALTNLPLVEQMASKTDLKIELGGGIRSLEDVQRMLDAGVSYPIIGTKALAGSAFLEELINQFREAIVIGIDARDGRVATRGWLDTSNVSALNLAKQVDTLGVKRIIFTDIATDGAFTGPNLASCLAIIEETSQLTVTVSGGVSSLKDLEKIKETNHTRIFGVIIGKCLYDNRIKLKDALALME